MRDDQGEEMHKSKGNAIWFEDAAERMGVDAMRWVFLRQNPALNINFGFRSADEVRRRLHHPAMERVFLLRDLRQHRSLRRDVRGTAGIGARRA